MPLLFDMPFEKLTNYQGTNPCPDDFDSYWSAGLAEMRSADPEVHLEPADFRTNFAECFHMWFTGVGGARIYARLLRPKRHSGKGPGMVMFHGYSASSGDWSDKLGYVAQGFTVAAMDCRGQGGLSQDPGGTSGNTLHGHIIRGLDDGPEKLLYRSIFLDAAQLAGIVMAMDSVDPDRVGATGMSQGGGLTLACAALEPRVRKAAPIYPFLSDYLRTWEIDQDVAAYAELREWFRDRDPQHRRKTEAFRRLGYIDVQHLAPRIEAEVLMAVGLMDTVCPPSTQFAAYNKISSRKSLAIYPDFGHEHLPDLADQIFTFFADL